jgi:hypothetical protein
MTTSSHALALWVPGLQKRGVLVRYALNRGGGSAMSGWFVGFSRRLVVVAVVVAAGALATPGLALAQGSGYFVTFVARSCPSYSDVFANKARNDIQESLENLGPDSPYTGVKSDDRITTTRRRW